MPHQAGFIHRQLDHPLGARGQGWFAKRCTFATADSAFHGADDLAGFDAQFAQHLYRHAILFAHKPKSKCSVPM